MVVLNAICLCCRLRAVKAQCHPSCEAQRRMRAEFRSSHIKVTFLLTVSFSFPNSDVHVHSSSIKFWPVRRFGSFPAVIYRHSLRLLARIPSGHAIVGPHPDKRSINVGCYQTSCNKLKFEARNAYVYYYQNNRITGPVFKSSIILIKSLSFCSYAPSHWSMKSRAYELTRLSAINFLLVSRSPCQGPRSVRFQNMTTIS